MEKFNYQDWLEKRAAKESTKTVKYSDLTKVEKISALFDMLKKGQDSFSEVLIYSTDLRPFGDCSAKVQSEYLLDLLTRNANGEDISIPKKETMVPVTVKTSFEKASLQSKIDYLESAYKKPVPEKITLNLPCGADWVKDLIAYCKGLQDSSFIDTFIAKEAEKRAQKETTK